MAIAPTNLSAIIITGILRVRLATVIEDDDAKWCYAVGMFARLLPLLLLPMLMIMIAGTASALAQPVANCHAIDGDTIVCLRETIRIENIDAAEMPPHAKCAYEADLAIKAKLCVGDCLARGRVELVRDQKRPRDRYGCTLELVKVDGVDLGEALMAAGLARAWDGKRRP